MARCIPPDNASNPTLYKSILGWTTRTTGTKIGDAQVRIAFGNDLWTAGLHQEAQTQFFQGDVQCAERLANIVFEWVLETSELEQLPRFSVRIILQCEFGSGSLPGLMLDPFLQVCHDEEAVGSRGCAGSFSVASFR